MRGIYERIAREALQDADIEMKKARASIHLETESERYQQVALGYLEIAKAATGLLVAVDDTKETAARTAAKALLSRLTNTKEDRHD